MREIDSLARQIRDSKHEHYKFIAEINDKKLETNFEAENSTSLSVEQEERVNKYLDKMHEKIRQGHGKK